jgi:hypothetical protein
MLGKAWGAFARKTPQAPRRSTPGSTNTTPGHSPHNHHGSRCLSSPECLVGLMMVESAQRHQIAQCMGINLPLRPRHHVMNVKLLRRPTLNTATTITIKRLCPLILVMCRRIRITIHKLPRPITRHRAERTTLRRPISLIRLPLKRLLTLNTRQSHPSCPLVIPALPRAVATRLVIALTSSKRNPTPLTRQINRRHVPAPFT